MNHNLIILPDSKPLNAPIYREIREQVYGGKAGVLSINYKKAYHPILRETFGVYYKGKIPIKTQAKLNTIDNELFSLPPLNVDFKKVNNLWPTTGENLGIFRIETPKKKKKQTIRGIELTAEQQGLIQEDTEYQLTAKLLTKKDKELETEKLTFTSNSLPLIEKDQVHKRGNNLNIRLVEIKDRQVTVKLENITSKKLSNPYQLFVKLKNEETGHVIEKWSTLNFKNKLYENSRYGDFRLTKIQTDIINSGIVVNSYGEGQSVHFNFNLLETDLPEEKKLTVLNKLVSYLTAGKEENEPLLPGETVAIESTITSLVVPVELSLLEELPVESNGLNYGSGTKNGSQIDWYFSLAPEESNSVQYHLRMPIEQGLFNLNSEIEYKHEGQYLDYKEYPKELEVKGAPDIINEIQNSIEDYDQNNGLEGIKPILKGLNEIENTVIESPEIYDELAREIVVLIDKWKRLEPDDDFKAKTHNKLINLLTIYQQKWYYKHVKEE